MHIEEIRGTQPSGFQSNDLVTLRREMDRFTRNVTKGLNPEKERAC